MKTIKPFFTALLLMMSTNTMAASETIPNDRTITDLQIYADTVVVSFSPGYTNAQNCSGNANGVVQFSIDATTGTGNAFLSTILAAAAAKQKIGFGINGCVGQYPEVYRIDLNI